MSDEAIINDVSETQEAGFTEAYIRLNDDLEKDYCFQIPVGKRFKDLLNIFHVLPIALRPSIFYGSIPVGFVVSTSPGYLTEDGSLLFSFETGQARFQKKVSLEDKVTDSIWPGQLIMPIWEFNSFLFYSFVSFLLCWLYTDLPDFASPTPGICLTNQFSRFLSSVARKYGYEKLSRSLIEDIEPAGITLQCLFFLFHLVKCTAIFFIIYTGAFNPNRVFRFSEAAKSSLEITKEKLMSIGWTGSRRAAPDEYKDFYREYKIKEYGGMVKAHEAGLFQKLRNLGVFLGEGEGFDTPLDSKATIKDLLDESNQKFLLSYEYIAQQGEFFADYLSKEDSKITEVIKQYRQYGLLHSSNLISKVVEHRKKFGDAKV